MKVPKRASKRLASKYLKPYSTWLPVSKQKEVSKLLNSGKVWNAVRSMYTITGNTSARTGISRHFFPKPAKYNASRNRIVSTRVNKRTTNKAIKRSIKNKSFINIIQPPLTGNNNTKRRGGVNSEYVINAVRNSSMRYATVGPNRRLKAFALIKNKTPNSRYINVIGAFPGYGHSLMNKIIQNGKNNKLNRINLKAVTHVIANKNANNDPLVRWYMSKGFVRSGPLNNEQLLPMSIKL